MADSIVLIKENMPAVPFCYLRPMGLVGQWRTVAQFPLETEGRLQPLFKGQTSEREAPYCLL